MSDDDSFSKVGFSDTESFVQVDAGSSHNHNESTTSSINHKIEVQLPPHFAVGSTIPAADASEASSFIPIRTFGKMKVANGSVSVASLQELADDCKEALKLLEKKRPPVAPVVVAWSSPRGVNSGGPASTGNKDDEAHKKWVAECTAARNAALQKLAGQNKEPNPSTTTAVPSSIHIKGPARAKSDDDSSVGWSVVPSIATSTNPEEDDSHSVANNSTISGFDLISLNDGSTQKKCKRCSFANARRDNNNICQGCGIALVANPSFTMDEQLARHLQLQEETDAFHQTVKEEKKRNSLGQQPLLFRAQMLAKDIAFVVKNHQEKDSSSNNNKFATLPEANLTILASRFIDHVDEIYRNDGYQTIQPCYRFDLDRSWRRAQIRQDGFDPNARFGSDLQAACDVHEIEACSTPPSGRLARLFTIDEMEPANTVAPKKEERAESKKMKKKKSVGGWERFFDDVGGPYYYNARTRQTTWYKPDDFDKETDGSKKMERDWERVFDDEGHAYYYNERTQQTTWIKPEGYLDVDEETAEAESKAKAATLEAKSKAKTATPPNTVAWIAAVVYGGQPFGDDKIRKVRNGGAWITRRAKSERSLPLVSFDPQSIECEHDLIGLLNGLKRVCTDFFAKTSPPDDSASSVSTKRHKVNTDESTEDDEALARALQASIDDAGLWASPLPYLPPRPPQGGGGDVELDCLCGDDDGSVGSMSFLPSGRPPLEKGNKEDTGGAEPKASADGNVHSGGRTTEFVAEGADESDGLVRVGVLADDSREHNLKAAAASLGTADGVSGN